MDMMTKEQAAKFLGVSLDTLERFMKDKKIAYYKLAPKIVRFKEEDLREYIDSTRVEAGETEPPKRKRRSWKEPENVYYPGMKVV